MVRLLIIIKKNEERWGEFKSYLEEYYRLYYK